jgi:hypothetical protein
MTPPADLWPKGARVRPTHLVQRDTPKDMLAGRHQEIHAQRDRKLVEGENSAKVVVRGPREERQAYVQNRAGEVDNFRIGDHSPTEAKPNTMPYAFLSCPAFARMSL